MDEPLPELLYDFDEGYEENSALLKENFEAP